MKNITEITNFTIEPLGLQEQDVYDIEVEQNHNFFANNILLHNSIYVNTEPLVPIMVSIYRPIIEKALEQRDPAILLEIQESGFWDNTILHFNQKSDIVKKYFLPHCMLEGNGLIESCIRFEVEKNNRSEFKSFCDSNKIDIIFKRSSSNNTTYFFIFGDDISHAKVMFKELQIDIKSYKRTYVLDDFSDAMIQGIIDENYYDLSEYLNARNKMIMKREAICINGFWLGAKNYCLNIIDNEGVRYTEPKTKVTGIIKSSTPSKVRESLKDFIKKMLSIPDINNRDSRDILNEYVDEFSEIFMQLNPEEMAFSVTVNNVESTTNTENGLPMKGSHINSTGAILFNKYITENELHQYEPIREGDKMKYIYLIKPNPFNNTHVMGFKDEGLPQIFWDFVDREKMLEKTFYDMLENIMACTEIELSCHRDTLDIMDFL